MEVSARYHSLILFFCLVGVFFSCSNPEGRSSWTRLQPAFGPVNQVNILMDKNSWDGVIGDTVRYYMGTPYPILLQMEPQFDLRYISGTEFKEKSLIKSLRTYLVFINLGDKDSETTKMAYSFFKIDEILPEDRPYVTKIARNKWADGQILFLVIGKDENALLQAFQEYYPTIASKINEFDENIIKKNTYIEGENKVLSQEIKENFGVNIKMPGAYVRAVENDTFGWYRFDQEKAISSILISTRKYTSTEQLEKEYLKDWMNAITREYITGMDESSYMLINDRDLPLLIESRYVNGRYAKILRGIWEMSKEFMGGTFVSYVIVDEKKNKLFLIEGFLLAPGEEKRNYMQRLEYIIKKVIIE